MQNIVIIADRDWIGVSDMNVLEKILGEIDKKADYYETDEQGREHVRMVDMVDVEEIIRSHMDDGKDTNVPSNDEIEPVSEEFLKDCAETAARYKRNADSWIPVEKKLPEDDRYILLSFENFSLPLVGRYEENEKGGAFYLGDCDEEDTCISNDLYVNAWTYLPERYKGDSNA